MINALGQMPNAPLIYVLAQIRFTQIPRMDKHWEDFHEQIFADYPKVEAEQIQQFGIKDSQPSFGETISRWHLFNATNTTGIIIDARSLIFHTTEYKASGEFLEEFEKILIAFYAILPDGVHISRVGLRYIDLLLSDENLTVDKQVIETLRLPQLEDVGIASRMEQIITYKTSIGGTMVIRHRQSITPDVLPADIFPTKLMDATRLKRDNIENSIVGLLDFDHFLNEDYLFSIEKIILNIKELRVLSSIAFKTSTTIDAQSEWSKEVN